MPGDHRQVLPPDFGRSFDAGIAPFFLFFYK
jgi:hypothetical protein